MQISKTKGKSNKLQHLQERVDFENYLSTQSPKRNVGQTGCMMRSFFGRILRDS